MRKLSLSNYTAISILEQLGLYEPTQQQINLMEAMVLMVVKPKCIKPQKIMRCVGENKLAYSFLYVDRC